VIPGIILLSVIGLLFIGFKDYDMELPEVAGRRLLTTHAAFERSCKLLIKAEQEKSLPDNHLIATLCNAIRLSREHCDYATRNLRLNSPSATWRNDGTQRR